MAKAPPGYFALGEFTEDGITYNGWQPGNDKVKQELILEARRGDELLKTSKVRMSHPNVWGVDVEDMAAFEAETDKVIQELKENG